MISESSISKCSVCADCVDSLFPFTVAFQPIMDVDYGTVLACEALVRGIENESAMQSPRSVSAIMERLLPRPYTRLGSTSADFESSCEGEKAITGLGYVPQEKVPPMWVCSTLASAVFALASTVGAWALPSPTYHFASPAAVGVTEAGTATITIANAGSLSTISLLTQGISNQDFTLASGGSCTVGQSYFAGQSCTVAVTFQPKYPGMRQGAAMLVAGNGTVLGSALLNATGVGAMGIFVPGVISTVAGDGQWIYRGDGGQATASSLFLPMGGATDAAGNLFLSDSNNQRIRRVDAGTGIISTVAGNGTPGFFGDGGLATSAMLDTPADVALDGAGNIYIADSTNHAVRLVNAATGAISTVAGTGGVQGYSGDGGAATAAHLAYPNGVAFDGDHLLYISDTGNNAIRRVDLTTGIITTAVGNGTAGYSGDGGPATAGLLNYPWGIALGTDGSVYIADLSNNCIRRVNPAGTLSTVVGTGVRGFGGDGGPATAALLNVPASVVVDVAGNLYVADSGNYLVRKVTVTTGKIETIAGTQSATPGGDGGPATNATLDGPYSVFLDGSGNLYISDMFHHLIRMVSANQATLSYPVMRVGRVSLPQIETLENDGNATLNFTALQLVSNSALDPTTTTCALAQAVAIDAICALGVEFAPTVTGVSVLGSVSLQSNAANSPGIILLSGQVLSVDPTQTTLTSSLNPAAVGAAVTFTAVVTTSGSTPPTGTVNFMDGTVQVGTGTLNGSSVATFTTASLAPGPHIVTAVYGGDSSNAAVTSPAMTESVKQPTTTVLTTSANPSIASTSVTFTATVTGPGGTNSVPGGTVTFSDGTVALGTGSLNSSGIATLTIATLSSGQHHITANYGGDTADLASQSSVLVQTVVSAATSTALSTSNASVLVGTSVTLTGVVSRTDSLIPTGAVIFSDGTNAIGTGTLDGTGTATLTITTLAVGTHSIVAAYQGDANNLTSNSAIVVETIQQIATTAALTPNPNPVFAGAMLYLTANIAASGGATTGGVFSGMVTYQEGATVLGTAAISNAGVATLNISSLSVGAHNITANYAGNVNYSASTSTAMPETVNSATTTTVLASSLTPSIAGKPVTLTATVTTTGGLATGTITFMDGATSLGTGTLNAQGIATLTTITLTVGSHTLTAAYGGDAKDLVDTSAGLSQTVQAATTAITLNSSSNPAVAGLIVTFSSVVTGNGGQPTGTVTFKDGSAVLDVAPLDSSGHASFATTSLSVGAHPLTAVYSGDANDTPSTSTGVAQVVNLATTSTGLVASPSAANQGTAVGLTASVSGSGVAPTGTVTFYDGSAAIGSAGVSASGVASLSLTTLAVGQHGLTAAYSGDALNAGSVSSFTAENILPTTTSTLSSNRNPAFAGGVLTLTDVVSGGSTVPTGTVTFRDGATVVGSGTLNGSAVATLSLSTLTVGQHSLTASYSGDSRNGSNNSAILSQMVEQATTQTLLAANSGSVTVGTATTLTATVSGTGGTPSGSVTFMDGTTTLGTGVVNGSGVATLTLSTLAPAQHNLIAVYTGDTDDLGSTSAGFQLTVQQATPALGVGSSANPSLGGVAVTFTISFSGTVGRPSGTITWRDGAEVLGTTAVSAPGTAIWTVTAPTIGQHAITATYSGDTNNAGAASAILTQTVQQGTSSIGLTSSASPASFGANVSFTASITVTGSAATGTVTFSNGAAILGTVPLSAGSAVFTTSTLAIGGHAISTAYGGDVNHTASQPAALSQNILQAGGVTLASSANPSIAETSLTLTATIAQPQGVAATGTVTFKDGAAVIGTGSVNSAGVSSLSLATLAVGQHNVTAVYGGDANNQAASSSLLVQTVQTAGTSVTLTSTANPSLAGTPIVLTSTVTGNGGSVTGSVTFQDGTTVIGVANVNGAGVATFIASGLAPGLHSIIAVYGGDANNLPSTSPVLSKSVKQSTAVALSSNQNPSLTPDPITFTAVVSNGGTQRPSGTVVFTDGTTLIGTVTVDTVGTATLSLPSMTAGQHVILVAYSGDALNLASASTAMNQSVQLRPTTNLLTASSTSLTGGQQVTLISVVRYTGPVLLTGTVTFRTDGVVMGTSPVDITGVATLTVNLLNTTPAVVASYNGDSIYAPSDSPVTSITVAKPTQFTMQINPAAVTLQSKQHSTATLTLTSLNNFADTLDLGCLGLPFGATCTFQTDQAVLAGNGVTVVNVVVDTGSALTGGAQASVEHGPGSLAKLGFLPGGVLLGLLFWKGRCRLRGRLQLVGGLLMLLLLAGASIGLSGCGGLQINGTPPGNYVFQLTASGDGTGVTQSMNVTLTVTQ